MAESKAKDAVALLKEDHRTVEELFAQFEKAGGDGRKQKLATQICLELSVHAKIEEEIFYPACEGKVEEDLLKEAYVEHDGAKLLIAEILAGQPSDEFYDSKVTVLQEQIEHHVEEEEKRLEGTLRASPQGRAGHGCARRAAGIAQAGADDGISDDRHSQARVEDDGTNLGLAARNCGPDRATGSSIEPRSGGNSVQRADQSLGLLS